MVEQALIAGAGIGGLAATLACVQAGWQVRVFERAPVISEVGAGIQLSPNITKILHEWGFAKALKENAAFPSKLQIRNADSGSVLAEKPLGAEIQKTYGSPYVTIHRADLQQMLLNAVKTQTDTVVTTDTIICGYAEEDRSVTIKTLKGVDIEGEILLGADGLWSQVRQQMLGDGLPRVTGHLAYRAMVPQNSLPASLQSQHITVWMGADLHVVQYPVRGGEWLNVVAIIKGQIDGDLSDWDHSTNAKSLIERMSHTAPLLQNLIGAINDWRLWALCDRSPVLKADAMAQGRVALLGDAAHPMRPYLAQGAGMAIEDAAELQKQLAMRELEIPLRLRRYSLNRWQRCARVQSQAERNGAIFHASGLVGWGRDVSLRLLGERLLDVPWLYRGV